MKKKMLLTKDKLILSIVITSLIGFTFIIGFDCSVLLLTPFGLKVFERGWLAIPDKDRNALFIAFLKNIIPIQFQEEWLGDLQEQHYQLINERISPRKVCFITFLTGLGLIQSYLWLEVDKFVSRWMTRAK